MEKSLKSFFDHNQISKNLQDSLMASTHRIYKIYYHLKFYNQASSIPGRSLTEGISDGGS